MRVWDFSIPIGVVARSGMGIVRSGYFGLGILSFDRSASVLLLLYGVCMGNSHLELEIASLNFRFAETPLG